MGPMGADGYNDIDYLLDNHTRLCVNSAIPSI